MFYKPGIEYFYKQPITKNNKTLWYFILILVVLVASVVGIVYLVISLVNHEADGPEWQGYFSPGSGVCSVNGDYFMIADGQGYQFDGDSLEPVSAFYAEGKLAGTLTADSEQLYILGFEENTLCFYSKGLNDTDWKRMGEICQMKDAGKTRVEAFYHRGYLYAETYDESAEPYLSAVYRVQADGKKKVKCIRDSSAGFAESMGPAGMQASGDHLIVDAYDLRQKNSRFYLQDYTEVGKQRVRELKSTFDASYCLAGEELYQVLEMTEKDRELSGDGGVLIEAGKRVLTRVNINEDVNQLQYFKLLDENEDFGNAPRISWDGKYLYIDNRGAGVEGGQRKILIYTQDGKMIDEIIVERKDAECCFGDERYLILRDGNQALFWDKKQAGNGSGQDTWKEVEIEKRESYLGFPLFSRPVVAI